MQFSQSNQGLTQNIDLQSHSSSQISRLSFAPLVVKTFQLPEKSYDGPNIYIEKYDMIISCPARHAIKFYNATTLLPFKERKSPELYSSIVRIAHLPDTEICLLACFSGNMFLYDLSTNLSNMVLTNGGLQISAMEFMDSKNYVFLARESAFFRATLSSLYLGKFFYGSRTSFPLKNKDPCSLHLLPKPKILLIGLSNSSIISVRINQIDRCPKMEVLDTKQSRFGVRSTTIKSAVINGKEYVITGGYDHMMRIWHFIKGKLRLLKAINTDDIVSNIVYLEKYKMVAVTCRTSDVRFFKLPLGKLVAKVVLGDQQYEGMFLMKEKNTLGVSCCFNREIKFVQLHRQ